MKKLLIVFLFVCCGGLHLPAMGAVSESVNSESKSVADTQSDLVTIVGTVIDEETQDTLPNTNFVISENDNCDISGLNIGDVKNITDADGNFKLSGVSKSAYVCFSYTGYNKKILPVTAVKGSISLSPKELVQITDKRIKRIGDHCKQDDKKIADGKYQEVTEQYCEKNLFSPEVPSKNRKCTVCVPTKCTDGYAIKEGVKTKSPNQCVECNLTNFAYDNASEVGVSDGVSCVITSCNDGFHPSDDKKKCEEDTDSDSGDDGDTKCQLKVGQNNIKSIDSENCVITGCDNGYTISNDKKYCISPDAQKKLEEAQQAYDEAKEKEQSLANRTLTAATVAATGIGGMQLAQGLSEQKADREAAADMAAYIATFRCDYANGKSVRASSEEIELPGGNNQNLMNYRSEYIALAKDLKERKAALGMKAGIESEEILDKTNLGLYDDENVGITSGTEASLYRAQMLKSEQDQAKIDEMSATSSKRVKGGAIAAGLGVVGGVLGNQIINGELGEKLKDMFKSKKFGAETQKLMDKEKEALDELKKCLKTAGIKGTDELKFEKFYASAINVQTRYDWIIDCTNKTGTFFRDNIKVNDLTAQDLFKDTTDAKVVYENMKSFFRDNTLMLMIGCLSNNNKMDSFCIEMLKDSLEKTKKKFEDAEKKDKENATKQGIDLSNILGDGKGFKDLLSDTDFMSWVQNVKK